MSDNLLINDRPGETKLHLAGVIRESIVDGPGWRFVVFVQGCPHHCKGCQNPQTWSFTEGGYDTTVENIMKAVKENKLITGVTLSGGEPFTQAKALTVLAKEIRKEGLDVMAFSGWTFEELKEGANEENGWMDLLRELSLLIDGRFIEEQLTLNLRFRGSKNQRIIDVQRSLAEGKTVLSELN
ncbi:MAG: anaerobic ribonucleoside-triphosphate reductase activating protein [Clostridia bacterium]|jgi:anaerobic ribonucleoside-triphosphate reductase activating protein|nr:anaerobic ribonucleoside-triphosphate reductase activating protein [Clostridia bacterium]MBQ1896128.1 anaerobic ribonucleoside-triphosphate reductase activating protein [Clostridia bacterium]MBQ2091603.1 anaerobic ribonucleoside-triphosphate reductase activating protein [Clostridia bacterium]MBQ3897106.1 anaerobic ribonucleoside-triphosphate reductase activating protein [Clostridia bacterium]